MFCFSDCFCHLLVAKTDLTYRCVLFLPSNGPFIFMSLFIFRVVEHHVENVTAVVWKEQRWDFCLYFFCQSALVYSFTYFISVIQTLWFSSKQRQETVLPMFWQMGSAQWDKHGPSGKEMHGPRSRSRDQDPNKDQFELEHVGTHSWAEGLIPIRWREAVSYGCTSGHKLAVNFWAVSTTVGVRLDDWVEDWKNELLRWKEVV